MKPLRSNEEISLHSAGVDSKKQRCWELQSSCGTFFEISFHIHAGSRGLKMCLPLLSITEPNTPRPIYNSTTGELIQFMGAGVFFLFFLFFFFLLFKIYFGFSSPQRCIYSLIPQPRLAHGTSTTRLLWQRSGTGCSAHMPKCNYLTDLRKRKEKKKKQLKTVFIQLFSICPSVSTHF